MILMSSAISALAMWLAAWAILRQNLHARLLPFLLLSLGVSFANYFLMTQFGWRGLFVSLVLLIVALTRWSLLPLPGAVIVAAVWLASQIAFGLFVSPIF